MNPEVLERARWFSWRRQRLDRTSRGVEDCLRSVIGVYSSNPQGPLSLLARVPRLLKGAAVEGVISTKRAVRIPAMRRSIFTVSAEHADAIFAATRTTDRPWWSLLERKGVSERSYEALRERILAVADAPRSVEEIRAALDRAPKALTEILRFMCAQGVLLRIMSRSVRTNDLTYAATTSWLGRPLAAGDPADAARWLAGEYLSGFGPATVGDFAWWSGLTEERAAEAVTAHDTIDLGDGSLLHRADERRFEGTRPMANRVNLLPKWDCYTMGYAPDGRARFADPKLLPLIYDTGGNASPVILVEGAVAGTWAMRLGKKRARITLSLFERPGARLRAALEDEARMVGTFLEADEILVDVERGSRRTPTKRSRVAARKPAAKRAPARGRTTAKRKPTAKRARTGRATKPATRRRR